MQFVKAFKMRFAIALISVALFLSLTLHIQPAAAQPINANKQISAATTTRSPEDIEFKQLVERSYAAWNTMNPDAVAKFYAPDADLVIYDALPLKYQGWEAFKAGIQTHLFDKLTRFHLAANDDFHATRQGNLVWATFTYHLSATLKNGRQLEVEGRQTDIWEQRNGEWAIVHEHTSTPVSL